MKRVNWQDRKELVRVKEQKRTSLEECMTARTILTCEPMTRES